jgi:hypothetical protein
MEQLRSARVQRDSTRDVKDIRLDLPGLHLELTSGRMAPFEPIVIDGRPRICAVYFQGKGQVSYSAPLDVERAQIRRFFDSDSIHKELEEALFFFSGDLYDSMFSKLPVSQHRLRGKHAKSGRRLLDDLFENDEDYFGIALYRALREATVDPFVLLNLKPRSSKRLYYLYDPFDRDEVSLWRHHDLPGESFMELVCAYPKDIGPDREGINGRPKALLRAIHYDLDVTINQKGLFTATAEVQYQVRDRQGSTAILVLHPDLKVNSVLTSAGDSIAFLGHDEKVDNGTALYVRFDSLLSPGEDITLTFAYQGEITRERRGYFYVTAGALWYPAPVKRERATFDMRFKTPGSYGFVATGTLAESNETGDTLVTHWIQDVPTRNVSFSIGPTDRHEFQEAGSPVVELYYSPDLHREIRDLTLASAPNMQEEVASDVVAALRLFSKYFGPYQLERIRVSEIIASHGEAFPGFLHMGTPTWTMVDNWGEQKLFRAHEVAHQWWGVNVGYASYRDQWLSEAFAEYSALLYLQDALGSGRLMEALERYRDDIYSVRKYVFGRGERSGSIALGYRTSSSETEGDYNLVVYKKGAYVLHMLRTLMMDIETRDDRAFFDLLRSFYQTYKGKDATTRDFIALAERYANMELDWFFDQWVYGEELPTYKLKKKIRSREDGTFSVTGSIEAKDVSDGFRMYVPLMLEFEDSPSRIYRYLVESRKMEFTIDGLRARPVKVKLNPFQSVLAKIKD